MTHLCTLPLKIEEKLSVALATYTRCRTTLDSLAESCPPLSQKVRKTRSTLKDRHLVLNLVVLRKNISDASLEFHSCSFGFKASRKCYLYHPQWS